MEKGLIISFSVAMIVASFLIGWWAKRKVTSNKAFFGSTGMFGPLAVDSPAPRPWPAPSPWWASRASSTPPATP